MNSVKVKFTDSSYDYWTSVAPHITEAEANRYFVGAWMDMGVFPKEDLQKCIAIEFKQP
jgi:hypothetical protein